MLVLNLFLHHLVVAVVVVVQIKNEENIINYYLREVEED